MSSSDHLPAVSDGRVSTGNPALDEILHGGLVGRRPYLIVGPSGTGKTTAALQFLCDGARRGERCLLVTLEEPPNEMKLNHPSLFPDLDRVFVFDAIPDVMRYERAPFKDISAVRHSILFGEVSGEIRQTPELSSVEVTFTALEQTLRMEMNRRNYTRLVIDSLTALQYFCMKGVDEVAGAQTFLRFLSDLRLTTVLTVEAPLEDVETPERLLARGEIRLFRWEFEGKTVRAIGVEKFRGSQHDIRLHPYRIGPLGLDIDLASTISRDTRQLVERPTVMAEAATETVVAAEVPASLVDSFEEEIRDLVALGIDVLPVRSEIESALAAAGLRNLGEVERHLVMARGLIVELVDEFKMAREATGEAMSSAVQDAEQRILARASETRAGFPPTQLPDLHELQPLLETVLNAMPTPPPATTASVPAHGYLASTGARRVPLRPPPSPPPPRLSGIGPPMRIGVADPEPASVPSSSAAANSSPSVPAPPPPLTSSAPAAPKPVVTPELPPPIESTIRVPEVPEAPDSARARSARPPPLPSFPSAEPAHAMDAPPKVSTATEVAVVRTPKSSPPAAATVAKVEQPRVPSIAAPITPTVAPVAAATPRAHSSTPVPVAPQAAAGTSAGPPPVSPPVAPATTAPRRRRRAAASTDERHPPAATTVLSASPKPPSPSVYAPAPLIPEPVPPIGATLEPVPAPPAPVPKKRAPRRRKIPPETTAPPESTKSTAPTSSGHPPAAVENPPTADDTADSAPPGSQA